MSFILPLCSGTRMRKRLEQEQQAKSKLIICHPLKYHETKLGILSIILDSFLISCYQFLA